VNGVRKHASSGGKEVPWRHALLGGLTSNGMPDRVMGNVY